MLFVHALLFLLLGTSAVARPVNHGQPQALHRHIPARTEHAQYSLAQARKQDYHQVEEGEELRSELVPLTLYGSDHPLKIKPPGLLQPERTLVLENIKKYVGVWYRKPSTNAHYNDRNDIMEILELEKLEIGIVVFHTLSKTEPGQVEPQYILLTSQNQHRLVGFWSRMPSVLPDSLYNDEMMVEMESNRLHYRVTWILLNLSQMSEFEDSTLRLSVPQPAACWGFWVRLPDESTPYQWAADAVKISASSNEFYSLGNLPGELHTEIMFGLKRMKGTWYGMPDARTKVANRPDLMEVHGIETSGMLHCTRFHRPTVKMLKGSGYSTQHSHP